ncbi:MAG TPA: hypothetical protein VLV78_09585 [Thermoanaerobaculia bacterium]|nr:hypothetical protein [Thermoanaerobaculia bacterium]
MFDSRNRLLAVGFLLSLAVPAFAEDKCSVKAVLGGTPVTMKHCAVALYDSEKSVTLVFSDSAFTAKQIEEFQESSSPPEKDASGKGRTMIHFAFCPGGGKPVPDRAAVKLVEMSVEVGSSPFLGFQNAYDLPKDKAIVNIEKLSGDLKLGGKLAGRITGGRMADGKKYSWVADFDMKLPAKAAFGGQGCGN